MSGGGGGGDRTDLGQAVGSGMDHCRQSYDSPINSPKAAVLGPLGVGSILQVEVVQTGSSSALVVKDAAGSLAGALTFVGYLQVINCIVQQGVIYTAEILSITGGMYTVRVSPT